MQKLFVQGKIRAIGVSNFSVRQMESFRQAAPLHVLQSPYNLFERGIETDLLPYCRAKKIATFGNGSLCRGLLSGRMQPDTTFVGDDLRRTDPKFRDPRFAQYLTAVRRLDRLARGSFDKRVIHLAIRHRSSPHLAYGCEMVLPFGLPRNRRESRLRKRAVQCALQA